MTNVGEILKNVKIMFQFLYANGPLNKLNVTNQIIFYNSYYVCLCILCAITINRIFFNLYLVFIKNYYIHLINI